MQPLNVIKDYYGEKEAFHFAWMIHYTGWLIPPSIVGLIFGITMMIRGALEDKKAEDWLHNPILFLYGIFMMLWVTCFQESWTRKQNAIANIWLVRDTKDVATECVDF